MEIVCVANCSLILVANECSHDFNCLKSFTKYFDQLLLYDNGLSQKNLNDIHKHFTKKIIILKDHKKYLSFSELRNGAFNAFKPFLKDWCLMIDDSYSITLKDKKVFEMVLKSEYDMVLCKLNTSKAKSDICRLFRKDCRFEGAVNESIDPTGKKITKTNCFELTDVYEDHSKSRRRNFFYVNHKDNIQFFRSYYHLALYCDGLGFFDLAKFHYQHFLRNNGSDKELNFITLIRLYELTGDARYLDSALEEYPPRSFEVYFKMGNWEKFKQSFAKADFSKFCYPIDIQKYSQKYVALGKGLIN